MRTKLLITVLSGSIFISGLAVAQNQNSDLIIAAKPKPKVVKADLKNGKNVYRKTCLMCHGAKGKGDGPAGKALKARDFTKGQYKWGSSDKAIKLSIIKGKGSMPGFKLSDKDVRDVTAYIRGFHKPIKKKK